MDREYSHQSGAITTAGKSHDRRRWLLPAGFSLAGVLLFGFVTAVIFIRGSENVPGWAATPEQDSFVVTECDPFARQSGLRTGDRIVSVSGDRTAGAYGPEIPLARISPNSNYLMVVRRNGVDVSVSLQMRSTPNRSWNESVTAPLIALLLYTVGAWIGTERWTDLTGRLAAMTFILSALAMLRAPLLTFPGWNSNTATIAAVLCSIWRPWHLPFAYDFLSRFPQSLSQRLPERVIRWTLYFVAAILWAAMNTVMLAQVLRLPLTPLLSFLLLIRPDHHPGSLAMAGFEALSGGIMCLTIWRNYKRLPDPGSRRRIRWASLGFCLALFVFLTLAIVRLALYLSSAARLPQWYLPAETVGFAVIGIAPLTLAYAVVKHRVLGIRVVIRQGLQYLLAKKVLQLVVLLPLIIVATQVIRNPNEPVTGILLHGSWSFDFVLLLTGSFSLRYRRQLAVWLDRKFFRQAYDQEQLLAELIDRINAAESEQELCMLVAHEVESAFHVDGFHILLRDQQNRGLVIAYSRLTERAAKLRDYINQRTEDASISSITRLYQDDASAPSSRSAFVSPRELLLVPLKVMGDGNIGVLILGPKRSDEPYTSRDNDLLRTVATQIGIAFEMLRLKQRVRDEGKLRVEILGQLAQNRFELLTECPDCGTCYTTNHKACTIDGAVLSLTLPIERTIEKKYQLERRIGQGAMGVVYKAMDLRLGRTVATKIMVSDLFGRPSALARFAREARAAALLDHPNIIRVHDFGEISSGAAYIVMEFISGQSWREYFRSKAAMPPQTVADLMSQLCSAVSVAHEKGIVHRDLKPENLMIEKKTGETRVVVLDFGLAQIRSEISDHGKDLTAAGAIFGTWDYMSPEQRAGLRVDLRTDIYSIGVVCAEMLSGTRPAKFGRAIDWLRVAIGRVAKDGACLTAVLEKALAESPSDRYTSIREFESELLRALTKTPFELAPTMQCLSAEDKTITHLPNP